MKKLFFIGLLLLAGCQNRVYSWREADHLRSVYPDCEISEKETYGSYDDWYVKTKEGRFFIVTTMGEYDISITKTVEIFPEHLEKKVEK